MLYKLRPYQIETVNKTLEYFNNKQNYGKAGLVIAPVASGKSLIIGSIAKEFGKKTVVLQPSVELLHQNSEKLKNFGGEFSIYSAKAGFKDLSDMTFATIGSIKSMGKEFKKYGIDTVLVDEGHLAPPKKSSMFRKFMDDLKPKHVASFTATPCRLYTMGDRYDSYSVLNFLTNRIGNEHSYFKNVIHTISVEEMVNNHFWSPIEYELYDFDEGTLRLNSTGAEFTEESIKKAIKEQGINNLIFKKVKELNSNGIKRNLIFCDSVETAKKMADIIPNSAYISGETDNKLREEIIYKFKTGEIWNVFNHGVLSTGFDYPELQTVIMGRPTNSYASYYQIAGRVVRIHHDKDKGTFIDFCNNVKRFGRLEDLTIEYIEGFGWGMFNGNKLLTNTRMGTLAITKELLKGELILDADDDDIKFWFGKHNGKKPIECPLNYLKWFLEEFKIKHNSTNEIKRLIFQVKRVIEKEKAP